MRDMPMNGAVGRARTMAGIRRTRVAEAAAAGIDTADRRALTAYLEARSKHTLLGIGDRARCRCGGDNHDIITAPMGATP